MIRPGYDIYEMHGFLHSETLGTIFGAADEIAGSLDGLLEEEELSNWQHTYKVTVIIERT